MVDTSALELELKKILIEKLLGERIGEKNKKTYLSKKKSKHIREHLHHILGAKDDVLNNKSTDSDTPTSVDANKLFDVNKKISDLIGKERANPEKQLVIFIKKKDESGFSKKFQELLDILGKHKIIKKKYEKKSLSRKKAQLFTSIESAQILAIKIYELVYGRPIRLKDLKLDSDFIKPLTEIINDELKSSTIYI